MPQLSRGVPVQPVLCMKCEAVDLRKTGVLPGARPGRFWHLTVGHQTHNSRLTIE